MPTIASLNVNLTASTVAFQKAMSTVQGRINSLAATAMSATAKLGGLFGVTVGTGGLILGLKSLVSTQEDFNRAMTNSISIMDGVGGAMRAKLEQAAIQTAKVTKFSATEIAKSYMFLASAGLNANQTIAAMPVVAKFAQAGNFELENATNLLVDAQSALGLKVNDTAKNMMNLRRVSDVLVKGNIISNSSVEDLSKALTNKAAAAIRALGKDMEEGVAVLAAFADQGTKGEEAGTALNIVLRDMQTSALQNAAAFRQHGIAVYDDRGQMRNVALIVRDIEKALAGLTDAQRKATLTQLGFTDKSVAFTEILIGTSGKIQEFEKALRAAGGATDEVASKNITPFQAALQRLRATWVDLSAKVGPPLIDMLVTLSKYAEVAINTFIKWSKQFGIFRKDIDEAREGIGDMNPALVEFAGHFEHILNVINAAINALMDWKILVAGGAVGGAGGFLLAGPAGILPGALVGAGAGIAGGVAGNLEAQRLRKPQRDMENAVDDALGKMEEGILKIAPKISDGMSALMDKVQKVNLGRPIPPPVFDASALGMPIIGGLGDLGLKIQDFLNKTTPINQGPELIKAGSEAAFNLNKGQSAQQNQPINQVQKNTQQTVKELIDLNKAMKDGIKLANVAMVDGFA